MRFCNYLPIDQAAVPGPEGVLYTYIRRQRQEAAVIERSSLGDN